MLALFVLALKDALHHIHSNLPANAYIFAHLDDIYIVCQADDAYSSFLLT